jgi:hypothetical protein
MTITCLNCQKPFESKRNTRQFCSDACRKAYKRKKPADNQIITTPKQAVIAAKRLEPKPVNKMSKGISELRMKKLGF